ncbi:MAG: hypothetical protein Q9192_003134 [Flavoplaca navasiana]
MNQQLVMSNVNFSNGRTIGFNQAHPLWREPDKPAAIDRLSLLPVDVLREICDNLSNLTIINCWRLSRSLRQFFTDPKLLRTLLLSRFRSATAVRCLTDDETKQDLDIKDKNVCEEWRDLFSSTVMLYKNLQNFSPTIERRFRTPFGRRPNDWEPPELIIPPQALWQTDSIFDLKSWDHTWHRVMYWPDHHGHLQGHASFDFHTYYSQERHFSYDDNLLLYCDCAGALTVCDMLRGRLGRKARVPFSPNQAVIHSFSIKKKMVLVEWVHPKYYRLFATFFIVSCATPTSDMSIRHHVQVTVPHNVMEPGPFFGSGAVWLSTHTDKTYACYLWDRHSRRRASNGEIMPDPEESLTVWNINDRVRPHVRSVPPLSHRTNEQLEELGVLQGLQPRLRYLCQTDLDHDKIFFVEQRSIHLKGREAEEATDATMSFEERIMGVPINPYSDAISIEDWYDATVPYSDQESWIRCLGSRMVLLDSRHGAQPLANASPRESAELPSICYMLNVAARVSITVSTSGHTPNFELNVAGHRAWFPAEYREQLKNTLFFQGDDSWIVGLIFENPNDSSDREPSIVAYHFGETWAVDKVR